MVRRPVIATDRAIVAEEEVLVFLVLPDWIVPGLQVPQMTMRIDDRRGELVRRRQGLEKIRCFRPNFLLRR